MTFFPSDPSKKTISPLPTESPSRNTLFQYFPETRRCVACQACSTACPQDIDVMAGVRDAINGDLAAVAERFTTCVMCGICAAVCESRIRPHRMGLYARRLTAAFYPKEASDLVNRIEEIRSGRFEAEWAEIMQSDDETATRI